MEKLQRRSDGFFETPSGLFAIAPRVASGRRGGMAWFEFRATHQSEVIRLEWPEGAPVIAVQQEIARPMLFNNYAFNITEDQMHEYNAAVDNYLAQAGMPPLPEPPANEPPPPPAVPEPPATAPEGTPPAVPEAPADAGEAKGKKGK